MQFCFRYCAGEAHPQTQLYASLEVKFSKPHSRDGDMAVVAAAPLRPSTPTLWLEAKLNNTTEAVRRM